MIAPDAEVELEASIELAARFQERLVAGDGVAEALRAARASIASEKGWSHPFFWARPRLRGLGNWAPWPRSEER